MRLIDADELIEHAWRDKVDSRELIARMIDNAPTVQDSINEVLDKIRAEIEQGYCMVTNDYDHGRNLGLYMATQILDKYKAESEE